MRIATLPVVVAAAIILSTPPVPVGAQGCCVFLGAPGICQFPADPVDCKIGDGFFVPDAVCNAATGECGVLQAAGNCCEAFGLCLAGPPLAPPFNCQLFGDPNFTFFPHAACSPAGSCVTEFCGDGVLQTSLGEQCDDGNNQDGDGCSEDCQLEPVIPILPQAGLFLFAGLLLGTSCWMIRRTFRTQA